MAHSHSRSGGRGRCGGAACLALGLALAALRALALAGIALPRALLVVAFHAALTRAACAGPAVLAVAAHGYYDYYRSASCLNELGRRFND